MINFVQIFVFNSIFSILSDLYGDGEVVAVQVDQVDREVEDLGSLVGRHTDWVGKEA